MTFGPGNTATMDSLVLIERLDELMAEAKPIPLTREARVDRDEVYKILDRLRTALPVEFERVRWLGKEAEQERTGRGRQRRAAAYRDRLRAGPRDPRRRRANRGERRARGER